MYIHFFLNAAATTENYTLSLHDALPIFAGCRCLTSGREPVRARARRSPDAGSFGALERGAVVGLAELGPRRLGDRKSTRLNSSHGYISYAVFCLKKKKY